MANNARLLNLASRLNNVYQRRRRHADQDIYWPDASEQRFDEWFFTPELISVNHLPEFQALPLSQKKYLSFFEAVNFFSICMHGEEKIQEGVQFRLEQSWPEPIEEYLRESLVVDTRHQDIFNRYCKNYAGKTYETPKSTLPNTIDSSEGELIFFAKMVIFEELVNYHNGILAKDKRLNGLFRDINAYHHKEKFRHLLFGRKICQDIVSRHWRTWGRSTRENIWQELQQFATATWKEYYNPQVYVDAGVATAYEWYEQAWGRCHRDALRSAAYQELLRFIEELGLLENRVAFA